MKETMKAARLYNKLDIRIEDVPIPEIGNYEMLIRTKSAFICGTDVRFYNNGKPGISASNPRILGHEMSGIIEKVGNDIAKYKPGMRVAVAPNYGCGICDLCVSGNSQLCAESEAVGVTVDGGFAEFVRIPELAIRQGNVVEIPDSLSYETAALAEPLSCVYNAYEKIGIYPGDTVLIIGSGPIGIMHAKVALMAGAKKVYVNDVVKERLDLIKQIEPGTTPVYTKDLKAFVMRETNNTGVDLVITAASLPFIQELVFSLAGITSRVMFCGGLPKGKSVVNLDTNEIHYKQITVTGTTRQTLRQFRIVLELLNAGKLTVDELVTSYSSLEEINKVIEDVGMGRGLKSNIKF